MDNKILRIQEVTDRVGLCKASVYSLIREGRFPAGVRLSKRARGWRLAEVQKWIEGRERA